jgi:hypothetical protein
VGVASAVSGGQRSANEAQNSALLPAASAISQLEAIGASLEQADARYATVRHELATSAGNAHMPRSVWVTHHAAWSPDALATLVGQLTSSSSLATTHALELVTVSLEPAAIPPPSGPTPPGGVTTVPPTSKLGVSLVLRDSGNVGEHDVAVTASVRELHTNDVHFHTQHVSLDPGTAVALSFAPLPVKPGHTYSVAIGVSAPSAAGSAGPTTSYTVAVAPAAPPPTTTTTTPSTTTSTAKGHAAG